MLSCLQIAGAGQPAIKCVLSFESQRAEWWAGLSRYSSMKSELAMVEGEAFTAQQEEDDAAEKLRQVMMDLFSFLRLSLPVADTHSLPTADCEADRRQRRHEPDEVQGSHPCCGFWCRRQDGVVWHCILPGESRR